MVTHVAPAWKGLPLCRHAAGSGQSRGDSETGQDKTVEHEPARNDGEQDDWRGRRTISFLFI